MKLLLTSTGFSHEEIKERFLSLLGSEGSSVKAVFIGNAVTNSSEREYADSLLKQIYDMGIAKQNITTSFTIGELKNVSLDYTDIIFVSGGNTFHLVKEVRESAFDKKLEEHKYENIIYVGVSAGTILITPDISIATIEPADDNFDNITNFEGLSFINFEISVHTPEIVKLNKVEEYTKRSGSKVITLSDKTGILCIENKIEILGERKVVIFNERN